MVQKLAIYMQSGIREYWVVDPQAPAVLVYWKDENGHQRYQVYGREDVISATSVPDLVVAVADILSP
jgi:Uma2 family endonuclease